MRSVALGRRIESWSLLPVRLLYRAQSAAALTAPSCMFRSRRNKDHEEHKEQKRFYLFPSQGGRAYHRKQWLILKTSVIVGLLVSALLALALYLAYRSPK